MLTFHKAQEFTEIAVGLDAPSLPPAVAWIDALAPTAEEISFLRRVLGVEPPTLAQMLEIEIFKPPLSFAWRAVCDAPDCAARGVGRQLDESPRFRHHAFGLAERALRTADRMRS